MNSSLIPHPSSLSHPSSPAFTLVELLVVIGIIGVLAAVLLGTFSKASESALSAACLVNMRSVATAWIAASQGDRKLWPTPKPEEWTYVADSNVKIDYYEKPGWISWDSRGLYNNHKADSSQASSCKKVGLYSSDFEAVQFALSNGSVYKHLSGNTSTYVCPLHKKKRPDANWSYFMNNVIKSDKNLQSVMVDPDDPQKGSRLVMRDRLLLFGEIPFRKESPGDWFPDGEGGSEETDAALELDGETPENIGANHQIGNEWVAHVAFSDGHVEKLRVGKKATGDDLRELSKLLVWDKDITFNAEANKYEEVR